MDLHLTRRDPYFLIYYRHGEILLMLKPRTDKGSAGIPLSNGDLNKILPMLQHGLEEEKPLWENPLQGPWGPRQPIVMARGADGKNVRVLQGLSLSSWIPYPAHVNPEESLHDFALCRKSMRDVSVSCQVLNKAIDPGAPIEIGAHYYLDAVSPNWIAHPFEGC